MKPLLTIFTPTYNRAHTISRTYESLCRQTCKNFCWLIIDDGSTDNTKELIDSWIADALIPITYIYQENQGMHGAHNTAYKNIHTELNTCIDSDDYMPDNAVDLIVNFWSEHGSEKYAGIIGLDYTTEGKLIGSAFPAGMTETKLFKAYEQGIVGDKKLVYRTSVIQATADYPIFEGEKFVPLGCKYVEIDEQYNLLTLNENLVFVEYQADGSTRNMYRQYWLNPRGFNYARIQTMKSSRCYKTKLKACIHYVASSLRIKNKYFINESPLKLLTITAIIPGLILYFFLKYKMKKLKL